MRPSHPPPNPPPSPLCLSSDIREAEARLQLAIDFKMNAVLKEMVQMDRNNLAANAPDGPLWKQSMRIKISL